MTRAIFSLKNWHTSVRNFVIYNCKFSKRNATEKGGIVFKFWYSVTSKNGSSFPQGEKEASDWEVAKPDGIGERKKSFFCSLYSPFLIPFSSVHSQGNVLFFLHSNFSIFPIIVYNSRPYIIFLLWKRG